MRAQAAIEFVFIFALIGMLGTILMGNWFSSDDELYGAIGVRQGVVKALDSIDTNKFYLKKFYLRDISCPTVNVEVDPIPDSIMVDKIKEAVRNSVFEQTGKSKTLICVYVNNPSGFFDRGCSC